jgi:hypothetical protein
MKPDSSVSPSPPQKKLSTVKHATIFHGTWAEIKIILATPNSHFPKISNKNVASASNKKVEEMKLRCTVRHQNDKWANTAVPNMWAADSMVAEGFSAGH